MTRCILILAVAAICALPVTAGDAAPAPAPAAPTMEDVRGLLKRAIIAADEQQKLNIHDRTRYYRWNEESIGASLYGEIARIQAGAGIEDSFKTATREPDADRRIVAYAWLSNAQARGGDKTAALETLNAALDLVRTEKAAENAGAERSVTEMLPHIATSFLTSFDVAKGQESFKAAGFDWGTLDAAALKLQNINLLASRGDAEGARKLLQTLPVGTLRDYMAQTALQQDRGADFYGMAAAPDDAINLDAYLLCLLLNHGQYTPALSLMEAQGVKTGEDALRLLVVASNAHDANEAATAEKADALIERWLQDIKDAEKSDPVRAQWLLLKAKRGKLTLDQLKADECAARGKGKDWASSIARAYAQLGDVNAALAYLAGHEINDADDIFFVECAARAGDLELARTLADKGAGLLVKPVALMTIGTTLNHKGRRADAVALLKEAYDAAAPIKATNAWFPDKGQVNCQQKDQVLNAILMAQIEAGDFSAAKAPNGRIPSLRVVGQTFGRTASLADAEAWLKTVSPEDLPYALLGVAEGVLARADLNREH